MDFASKIMNGPIPGENFTTDTRNFPWHRPPQYTKLDDAIEACIKDMLDDEKSSSFLLQLQIGFSVVDVTQMIIMSGISEGKWTFDFGLLMAGPIAHVVVLMARGEDIPFELGTELETFPASKVLFDEIGKMNPQVTQSMSDYFGADSFDPEPAPDVSENTQEASPLGNNPSEQEVPQPEAPTGLGGF